MSTERYSHPPSGGHEAVLLQNHLTDVADRAREIVPEDARTPSDQPMAEFVARLALVHDFGKLTTWFQRHIGMRDGDLTGEPTHHALLGAVLVYYVLNRTGYEESECLAGYVAVAKHHGTLPDVPEYVFERNAWAHRNPLENARQEEIIAQAENIDENARELAETFVADATDGNGSWKEFARDLSDEAHTQFEAIKRQVSLSGFNSDAHSITEGFYPCLLQAWSALVVADKSSAAHAPRSGFESESPPRAKLEGHIEGLPADDSDLSERESILNERREHARRSVLENVGTLSESNEYVATLTLPTGMGKTLTGLNAALTLRDLTDRERVVYALPFTSIIDQVVAETEKVFDTDGTDSLLTVHHHLAETLVELDGEEDTDEHAGIEEMLGESWRSGLVVTTFVQLFESLVGPKNTQSMKLPALYDSVIVLDEPQSLPHDWWVLVRRLVEILTTEYDATVIAMTATQPRLFGGDPPELVDDAEVYFTDIERVEYRIDGSVAAFDAADAPVSYPGAAERIARRATEDEDDVLAVCNTIDSAQELTGAVAKRTDALDVGTVHSELLGSGEVTGDRIADAAVERATGPALIHLSTRIRPCDRLALINAMKELTDRGVPTVVVSTQLIEAGVDVSFDRVYRDFAPIDSIVQAAGRCNRSFERERGSVTVWWLDSPKGKEITPGEAVYNEWGDSLLSVTAQVLGEHEPDEWGVLPESTVAWDGVREYYRLLTEERRIGKQSYVDLLDDGAFDEAGALSLIDQRLALDVIVCRTDDERATIEAIKEAWASYDFERVQELLDTTKQAQVSVPIYREDSEEAQTFGRLNCVHSETDIRWLDTRTSQHETYFDATTGLVVPDNTVSRRFL